MTDYFFTISLDGIARGAARGGRCSDAPSSIEVMRIGPGAGYGVMIDGDLADIHESLIGLCADYGFDVEAVILRMADMIGGSR